MSEMSDLYQEIILDHYKRPRNRGRLDDADRHAVGQNPLCGDHVVVFAKVKDDIVEEVTFEGSGCAISTASASLMTDAIKGKTLDQAKALFRKFHALVTNSDEVDHGNGLGKLTVFSGVCRYPVRVKCATLAWHTLVAALENRRKPVSTE